MTASDKKPSGFFFYPEHLRAVCALLPPAQMSRLLLALCDYAESGALPDARQKTFCACFSLLQNDIDRDAERYREICERNRERANKRWHPDECPGMPPHAYTTQPNPTQPNPTQPNTTQPNPRPAAAAARPDHSPEFSHSRKGDQHERTGNHRQESIVRGIVL